MDSEMSIWTQLHCDWCKVGYETDREHTAGIRNTRYVAKSKGWVRVKWYESVIDLCPQCKKEHKSRVQE